MNGSYDYLINMSISSLTQEKADKLKKDLEAAEAVLVQIKKKTPKKMTLYLNLILAVKGGIRKNAFFMQKI